MKSFDTVKSLPSLVKEATERLPVVVIDLNELTVEPKLANAATDTEDRNKVESEIVPLLDTPRLSPTVTAARNRAYPATDSDAPSVAHPSEEIGVPPTCTDAKTERDPDIFAEELVEKNSPTLAKPLTERDDPTAVASKTEQLDSAVSLFNIDA
jgi:hypothetical protein